MEPGPATLKSADPIQKTGVLCSTVQIRCAAETQHEGDVAGVGTISGFHSGALCKAGLNRSIAGEVSTPEAWIVEPF